MNNTKVIEILNKSGWYEGRNMYQQIKESKLVDLLPQTVFDFYCSFIDLTIQGGVECLIVDKLEDLYKTQNFEYYLNFEQRINNEINTTYNDDAYYYSVLLGTQIYSIGILVDRDILYLDKFGNFYVHTHINTFYWIANSTEGAFAYIFFGEGCPLGLNEEAIEWVKATKNTSSYIPPLNKNLTKNPW